MLIYEVLASKDLMLMRVFKNFIYNMSYQILVLITPLITVPYVSRVLGAEGVGINTFTNSVIQYFVLFGSIGITLYGSREIAYVQNDMYKRSQKFFEIELLKLVTIAISYTVFFIFLVFYGRFRMYMVYQSILILAAGADISWFYTGLENFRRTVTRNTVVKIAGVILIFAFVRAKDDLGLYILLLSLVQLLGNLTLWPYLKKDIEWIGWKNLNIHQHFYPAVQLFIPQIAIQIYWVLNRTMLGQMVSVESAGFFQYADQFIKMALAVATATGPVLLPRVSSAFASGNKEKVDRYLKIGFEFVSMLAFPLMFGIVAIAGKFAPWFMGSAFKTVGRLMVLEAPIIVFVAWSGVIGQQFLLPVKRVKEYTTSVMIGVVVNIVLNILLIRPFGANGAMVATVCAELFVTLYQLYRIHTEIDVVKLLISCWPYLLSSVVMFVPVFWYMCITRMSILTLIVAILLGIGIYFGLMFILHVPIYQIGIRLFDRRFSKKNTDKDTK